MKGKFSVHSNHKSIAGRLFSAGEEGTAVNAINRQGHDCAANGPAASVFKHIAHFERKETWIAKTSA
jgi:hypothetical protein